MSLLGRYISTAGVGLDGPDLTDLADQTSNGNDFDQVVGINRPTLVPNAYNGFPVIRFTATQFLESLSTSGLNVDTKDITLVYVGINKSNTNNREIFNKQQGGQQRYRMLINNDKGRFQVVEAGLDFYTVLSSTYTNFTNHLIMQGRWNTTPNTAEMHLDGVLDNDATETLGTVTASLDTTTKATIGLATNSMDADLLELRIYDSNEDFDAIFTELNTLYSSQFSTAPTALSKRLLSNIISSKLTSNLRS